MNEYFLSGCKITIISLNRQMGSKKNNIFAGFPTIAAKKILQSTDYCA